MRGSRFSSWCRVCLRNITLGFEETPLSGVFCYFPGHKVVCASSRSATWSFCVWELPGRAEGIQEKSRAARGAAHTPQVPCPLRLDACKFQVFYLAFHLAPGSLARTEGSGRALGMVEEARGMCADRAPVAAVLFVWRWSGRPQHYPVTLTSLDTHTGWTLTFGVHSEGRTEQDAPGGGSPTAPRELF